MWMQLRKLTNKNLLKAYSMSGLSLFLAYPIHNKSFNYIYPPNQAFNHQIFLCSNMLIVLNLLLKAG